MIGKLRLLSERYQDSVPWAVLRNESLAGELLQDEDNACNGRSPQVRADKLTDDVSRENHSSFLATETETSLV